MKTPTKEVKKRLLRISLEEMYKGGIRHGKKEALEYVLGLLRRYKSNTTYTWDSFEAKIKQRLKELNG